MLRNIQRRISCRIVLLTILAAVGGATAWPQPQSSKNPMGIPDSIPADIDLDQLKAKKASIEDAADLDATNKKMS